MLAAQDRLILGSVLRMRSASIMLTTTMHTASGLVVPFFVPGRSVRGYLTALPWSVSLALRNQSTPPLAGTASHGHSAIDSSSCHRPWLPALVLHLSTITRFACNLGGKQSPVNPGWLDTAAQAALCESEKCHQVA
ncbi:hypothetical protein K505DRAFT_12895 [Melanomma pulvis-pyrius CBS 109.77]|uniref:Uncharacterized protein n=1 Tax=Melanomma pulvis-pyrius CBS 109.77 TaxID=1314802 RepID=A0A6A6XFX6_9PLEO|nr:hypothetical protein K505DRAFT_12895 [Melanomma pulvis-pyrius CBS 109.77]